MPVGFTRPTLTSFEISEFVYLSDEVPTLSIGVELAGGDQVISSVSINFTEEFYRTNDINWNKYVNRDYIDFNYIDKETPILIDESYKFGLNNKQERISVGYLNVSLGEAGNQAFSKSDLEALGFRASFEIMNGLHRVGSLAGESLVGDTLRDHLEGLAGDDTLLGFAGRDWLDGGAGADVMQGGAGNDTYIVDATTDLVEEMAGEGDDLVLASATVTLADNVERLTLAGHGSIGGSGNALANVLTGNDGMNVLDGAGGDDTLIGGAASDRLFGGDGRDDLSGGSWGDLLSGGVGRDTLYGGTGGDTLDGGEDGDILLGEDGKDILAGGADADSLDGGSGNDTLYGGAGDDTLLGGTGANVLSGGTGDDLYRIVAKKGQQVIEEKYGGIDTVVATADFVLPKNVERLVLEQGGRGTGNELANIMIGKSGYNKFQGLGGDDTILGGSGRDTLDGGFGNDSLVGGLGDDAYIVDSTSDLILERKGGGTDILIVGFSVSLGKNIEDLRLTGTKDLSGTGNGLRNEITGNSGANLLSGKGGNDTIRGNGGNDTLWGGTGNDTLKGGAGANSLIGGAGDDRYVLDSASDQVIEVANGGHDEVITEFSMRLMANVEDLYLNGKSMVNLSRPAWGTGNELDNTLTALDPSRLAGLAGDDTLYGGSGFDTLSGGDGRDLLVGAVEDYLGFGQFLSGGDALFGGADDDALWGYWGPDLLTGGEGSDLFAYWNTWESYPGSRDTITDFSAGDVIDLSRIDAYHPRGGDQAFVFAGKKTAGMKTGYLYAGNNLIEADVSGDGKADLSIRFEGDHVFVKEDFLL